LWEIGQDIEDIQILNPILAGIANCNWRKAGSVEIGPLPEAPLRPKVFAAVVFV
jgi:hypothetical protein